MGNLNLWEEKFKICHYSLKLTTLIQTLNQNSKNPIDLNIIKNTIRYLIPLTMHLESKNVEIEFFKLPSIYTKFFKSFCTWKGFL